MDAIPFLIAEVLALSAGVTWALMPLIKRLAWRCGAVAQPDAVRRLHAQPTPLWGGVGLFLGATVAVAVACEFHPKGLVGVLGPFGLAAGALWLVGMWDDVRPLPARFELACQIGVSLLVVCSGFYPEGISLLGYHLHLGRAGAVFMLAWLVLGINAVNLIDGMDALASVIGIVISTAVAIIAGIQGNLPTLVLALAMAGGLAGFLVHNLPPATIFLGDSGSTVIGLVLAFLAFQVASDSSATMHVTLLALLLFVPLLDTHLAITRRLLMGKNIFHGDRSHLHHQLLGQGLGVWRTLRLLGAYCGVCAAAACLAAVTGGELVAWAVVLASTGLLFAGGYIGGQEVALLRQILARVARGTSEAGPAREPLSHGPEIIPIERGLARMSLQAGGDDSQDESAEPSEERRVA